MPQNPYAQPPSWYEQNLPLMQGLGTLHSSQMRYLTEPTGYPVNPANARARALQDSLAAYYNAIPQQQQMEQRRIQQEQNARLFDLQVKDYERKAEQDKYQRETIRPLTKQQMEGTLEGQENTLEQQRWAKKNLRPEQLKRSKLETRSAELELKKLEQSNSMYGNWKAMVEASGGTEEEKHLMLLSTPSAGLPLYQQVITRKKYKPLKEETLKKMPAALQQIAPFMKRDAAGNIVSTLEKDLLGVYTESLELEKSGWTAVLDNNEKIAKYGIPEDVAPNTIVHVSNDPKVAPRVIFPAKAGRKYDMENSYQYVAQANIDVRNGERSAASVENDERYSLSWNRLWGRKAQIRFTNQQGQLVQRLEPLSRPPVGIIAPNLTAELPVEGDTQKTQERVEQSRPESPDPAETILSERKALTDARIRKIKEGLKGTSLLIVELAKFTKDMEQGILMPHPGNSRALGKRKEVYQTLKDAIRIARGYGAPQLAEMAELKGAIADPTEVEFITNLMKHGGDPAEYIMGQIDGLKGWVKLNNALLRHELAEGRQLDPTVPADNKLLQELVENQVINWGLDSTTLTHEFSDDMTAEEMEALIFQQPE